MCEYIHSLADYVSRICESKDACKHFVDIQNEILLFRGHSDKDYRLMPTIGRDRESDISITIFNHEDDIIKTAQNRLPDIFCRDLYPLERLALMQHYGLPTRLLDVTTNAFVALYFACCSKEDKDGEVIVFKYNDVIHTDNSLFVEAIADSGQLVGEADITIKHFAEKAAIMPYSIAQRTKIEGLLQMKKDDMMGVFQCENIGDYFKQMLSKPLFVNAPARSLRQQMQQGWYILFPNRIGKDAFGEVSFKPILDEISKTNSCICDRILISHEDKSKLLGSLESFGISQATLFADSTDIVCKDICHTFEKLVK